MRQLILISFIAATMLGACSTPPPRPLSPTQRAALALEAAHEEYPAKMHNSLIPYYRYEEDGSKNLQFIPRRGLPPKSIYFPEDFESEEILQRRDLYPNDIPIKKDND
ncbi:MAG: hypothetical protein ACO4AU_12365 [bacterium]